MASSFCRIKFLSTKRGEMALALGAYVFREDWLSELTRERFDHSVGRADLVCAKVLVPDDAPEAFRDARSLCEAADRAEVSTNKRNRKGRWKKRAQIAMHIILELPDGTTDAVREALVTAKAECFRQRGCGVIFAIHRPDDPPSQNHHAHLLVFTRRVTPLGFGKKVRNLAAAFSRGEGHDNPKLHKDSPPTQWRRFMENFARQHGLEFEFDPPQAVGGIHRGHRRKGENTANREADARARAEARALLLDPDRLLAEITRRQAVFTRKDLFRLLYRHEIVGEEAQSIVSQALASPEILHLVPATPGAKNRIYSTRSVRAQEMYIHQAARRIAARSLDPDTALALDGAVGEIVETMPLAEEQKAALRHCTGASGLAIVQGLAGAGKSYTMAAIRTAYERAGFRVIGAAPTNSVAADMAAGGFHHASTIHLEMLRQETGTGWYTPWDDRTCIILDEAAMVDANMYQRVLRHAASTGARLVLVGDDQQLSSIERGGIYAHLQQTHGCAYLREVRRQAADWAKEASLDFAEGRILEGLTAYQDRGFLSWHRDIGAAAGALVRQWRADHAKAPDKLRFVYAATNDSVNELNRRLQEARWSLEPPTQTLRFPTARGETGVAAGDRLQFFGNDRKLGIVNGLLGTVLAVAPNRITVAADGGGTVAFDPRAFDNWGLGFAGTIYRGQGRTQLETYCLYDHAMAWGARSSYVAFTRHKESVRCYVPKDLAPDLATLADQMSRSDPGASSLAFVSEEESKGIIPFGPAFKVELDMDPTPEATLEAGSQVARSAVTSEIKIDHGTDQGAGIPTGRIEVDLDMDDLPDAAPAPQARAAAMPAAAARAASERKPAPAVVPPTAPAIGSTILPAIKGPSGGGGAAGGNSGMPLLAVPYRARLAGAERRFDLSLAEDRDDLLKLLAEESMGCVVQVYDEIRRIRTQDKATADQLANFRGRITSASRLRGFLPRENKIDKDCLANCRLDTDNMLDIPSLAPRRGEVDIRPLTMPLLSFNGEAERTLRTRARRFVIEALRAIDYSLGEAGARSEEEQRYSTTNARRFLYSWTYRWGKTLHPDWEGGKPPTPCEYRSEYLLLAQKAAKATRLMEPVWRNPSAKNQERDLQSELVAGPIPGAPVPAPAASPYTGQFTTIEEYEAATQARRDRHAELEALITSLSETLASLGRAKAAAADAHELGRVGFALGEAGMRLQVAQEDLARLDRLPMPTKITAPRSAEMRERETEERAAVLGGARAGERPRPSVTPGIRPAAGPEIQVDRGTPRVPPSRADPPTR